MKRHAGICYLARCKDEACGWSTRSYLVDSVRRAARTHGEVTEHIVTLSVRVGADEAIIPAVA